MKQAIVFIILLPVMALGSVIIYTEIPFVSGSATDQALSSLRNHLGKELNKGSLIIVDYSRPSHTKRLSVMDLKSGDTQGNFRVTHGKNSGIVIPSEFSNTSGSFKSSLGLFKVAETFNGKHGPSLRLLGLDPGVNSNALTRGIIIHSAAYAEKRSMLLNWKKGFRLGRSEGCFVLAREDYRDFRRSLERPVYLYSYASRN